MTQAVHPNIPQESYSYDPVGNRISSVIPVPSVIPANAGIQSITYAYDPLGRRIQKNVNGAITKYLYDNEDIIAEFDSNNNITARYLHGPGIDEPLKGLSPQGTVPEWYYHTDALGSVTALTDSTGAVIEKYTYDAYGNVIIKDAQDNVLSQSAVGNPYTYTGRELDPETGLYYYRARYYDPKIGRFLQEDPIWDVNLYGYAGNNPVNMVDPYGQSHVGFIKAVVKMANISLRKTIKFLKKVITKHANPLDSRDIKKYAHEKKVAEEQLKIAKEEAKRRGLLGIGLVGTGSEGSAGSCEPDEVNENKGNIIDKILEPIVDIIFDTNEAY